MPSICLFFKGYLLQVTKRRFWHKPTLQDFEDVVLRLRALLEEMCLPHIALPWLGCGEDRLSREVVWGILHRHFSASPIIVTLYEQLSSSLL